MTITPGDEQWTMSGLKSRTSRHKRGLQGQGGAGRRRQAARGQAGTLRRELIPSTCIRRLARSSPQGKGQGQWPVQGTTEAVGRHHAGSEVIRGLLATRVALEHDAGSCGRRAWVFSRGPY